MIKTLKTTLSILGLLWLCLLMPRFALAADAPHEVMKCAIPTTQEVSAFLTQWTDALKTKNPDIMTSLYADNAVLLPTLSNQPRMNHQTMRAYFVEFLKKKPVASINQTFINLGCNWASNTGIYTFQLTDEKEPNKTKKAKARFSYVYEKVDGKWLIINHHSSVMPEKEDGDD